MSAKGFLAEFAEVSLYKRAGHPEPGRKKMYVFLITVSRPVSKGWEGHAILRHSTLFKGGTKLASCYAYRLRMALLFTLIKYKNEPP